MIRLGGLEIDSTARIVSRDGSEVHLTPIEFALLARLARAPHVVFGRSRLLNEVWGYHEGAGERTVDSHIRACGGSWADVIRTVHGSATRSSRTALTEAARLPESIKLKLGL